MRLKLLPFIYLLSCTTLGVSAPPFCPHGINVVTGEKEPERHISTVMECGKIISVLEESGSSVHFRYREGETDVIDPLGNVATYYYSKDTVYSIKLYDRHEKLMGEERFEWHPSYDLLKTHAVFDGNGALLRELRFEFDERGLLEKETLIGSLTSHEKEGEEYHSRYSYDESSPPRLQKKWEDNGDFTHCFYDDAGRLTAKITQETGLFKRQFFILNAEGSLIETIIDNGESIEEEAPYTERKRLVFTPSLDEPLTLAMYIYNPETGIDELSMRIENLFSEESDLLCQEFFKEDNRSLGRIKYQYDADGNKTAKLDDFETGKEWFFDENRRLLSTCEYKDAKLKNQIVYSYNTNELPEHQESIDEKGEKSAFFYEYNALKQCKASFDPLGNCTSYEYDPAGNLIRTVYPEVLDDNDQCFIPEERAEFDLLGRMISYQDMRKETTKTLYTSRGKPSCIFYPDGTVEKFEYRLDGSLSLKISKEGLIYQYDSRGKPLFKTSSDSKKDEPPSADKNTNENRAVQKRIVTNALGQSVLQYLSIDEEENITEATLDALGRATHLVKKNCFHEVLLEQENRYDGLGNKTYQKDLFKSADQKESALITRTQYGPLGRIEKIIEASDSDEMRVTKYEYDSFSRLTSLVKPDGVILSYEYDSCGRLKELISTDQTVSYRLHYNEDELYKVEDLLNCSATTIKKTKFGAVEEETFLNYTLKFDYDDKGKRRTLHLPDGSGFLYEWKEEEISKIHRLNQDGSICYTYTFSEERKEDLMIGDLGKISYHFDDQGRLLEILSPYFAESIPKEKIDSKGRIHETTISDKNGTITTSYTYDECSRLVREEGIEEKSYIYDTLSNRYKDSSDEYNSLCQLIRSKEGPYEYDLNGNLRTAPTKNGKLLFKYDALNRLSEVLTEDGALFSYTYDFFNRRIKKSAQKEGELLFEENYLYDGLLEIGSMDANGVIQELRMLGPGIGAEVGASLALELHGELFAPLQDHRGFMTCLVSLSKKEAVQTVRFSAFKEEEVKGDQKIINPWRFSGKRTDPETGFVYYGRRYLNPECGRWITPDPLYFIEGANRYQFVLNNPISSVDLYGGFSLRASFSSCFDFLHSLYTRSADSLSSIDKFIQDRCSFETFAKPTIDQIAHSIFGETMLVVLGYIEEQSAVGVVGKGEKSNKVRVTVINGILNIRSWAEDNAEIISSTHADINIHYIYRPTRGWTQDILKSGLIKFGYASDEAKLLARTWKKLIQEMGGVLSGGVIVHYAHSIGAGDTAVAQQFLTPEEQKMIRVISLGAPLMIPHEGFHSVINYISIRDGILILAPLSHFSTFFYPNHNVIYLDSYWGIPVIDHLMNRGTYKTLLETLGREFINEFLPNQNKKPE